MFVSKYLVVAAAAIAAAAAMPHGAPRSLQLSDMINNTVCAIQVKYDVNQDRIPQRIKMLKCAQETDQWCVQRNISHHDCCHHTSNRHVMECVEMIDTVVVFNKLTKQTETYPVSVGCTCMISRSTGAPGLPGPP